MSRAAASGEAVAGRWLLLIHQLPPKPDYFRVKIWRRLQRVGAVAIKNSVYVLPCTDQAAEDFQWVRREIVAGGGEASVCRASFVDGLSDAQIETLFRAARDAEYADVARQAEDLLRTAPAGQRLEGPARADVENGLARLRRRTGEISTADFFGAPAGGMAESALQRVEARLRPPAAKSRKRDEGARFRPGRVWVTRRGVYVDRIASAWLIRRFVDPKARFRLVASDYRPAPGEVRFDMFEAEYTHEGDRCTFETLVARFAPADAALQAIGEMVHDIDCKDARFGRPETPGLERLIAGMARAQQADDDRLAAGAAAFDALYESFAGGSAARGPVRSRPKHRKARPSRTATRVP
ncbi:MAG TPA: chromate resistance protein ChrB domain-containing protein [Gemmatimonadales bacterium]|nr:chromate resistance protein ChrB domain-containing protein [Gemmatimonadales bacterium]